MSVRERIMRYFLKLWARRVIKKHKEVFEELAKH